MSNKYSKSCKKKTLNVSLIAMFIVPLLSAGILSPGYQAFAQSNQTSGLSVLKLPNTNVLMDIPMFKAYENGQEIYLIATDASDKATAEKIGSDQNFTVNVAPLLAQTPEDFRGQAYIFDSVSNPSQLPIVNATPGDDTYSPLYQLNIVTSSQNASDTGFTSEAEVLEAENAGDISINRTSFILNSPAIQWDGGSLPVREDSNVTDATPYGGGQVTEINTEEMVVTMVAHRGWNPDGSTVYYIVTDATPKMPADMMGVNHVPNYEKDSVLQSPIAPDLFQFSNGIKGPGPMGFQAGIGGSGPLDENYSPIWKISFIEWKDPQNAMILETLNDINTAKQQGLIDVNPAMEGKHLVNCPFFEPSVVFENLHK